MVRTFLSIFEDLNFSAGALTRSFQLSETDLFQPSMLYDYSDFAQVLHTLSRLSQTPRAAAKAQHGFPVSQACSPRYCSAPHSPCISSGMGFQSGRGANLQSAGGSRHGRPGGVGGVDVELVWFWLAGWFLVLTILLSSTLTSITNIWAEATLVGGQATTLPATTRRRISTRICVASRQTNRSDIL